MPRPPTRKRDPQSAHHEPDWFDAADWVEWGGELYWAVDFTAGGAPIGFSAREFQDIQRRETRAPWSEALHALESLLCGPFPDSDIDIGTSGSTSSATRLG